VVLSRTDAIDWLDTVMVTPITTTIRGLPSEIVLGVEHGLKTDSAVNLDHVQTIRQNDLRRYVSALGAAEMAAVCRALAIAAGCTT
jgi:mRNA interferase MazF